MSNPERNNSFTFLRQFFALAVVVSHSFVIGGFGHDPLFHASGGREQIGSVAVLAFFVVSGFLITQSLMLKPSLSRFVLHRAARILPGFWVNLAFTGFVLAPVIITWRFPGDYSYVESLSLGNSSALSYVVRNALVEVRQYGIDPLFFTNKSEGSVNGSLWSLAPELFCYGWLVLLFATGVLRRRWFSGVLFATFFALHAALHFQPMLILDFLPALAGMGRAFTDPAWRSLYLAFVAGMFCFQLGPRLRWQWRWFLPALGALGVSIPLHVFDLVWPIAFPYAVLFLAHRLPFGRFEKAGDFSYGIYIYSFPLQQCLVLAGVHHLGLGVYVAASLLVSVAAGFVSWRLVEQPVLNWARNLGKRPRAAIAPEALTAAG